MPAYPQGATAVTQPGTAQHAAAQQQKRLKDQDQLLLTVDQAAALMNMGRDYIYGEMNAGHIRSLKLGWSRRIPRSEVVRRIEELLAEQCPAAEPAV